jgi:serine O-acetyltransferase
MAKTVIGQLVEDAVELTRAAQGQRGAREASSAPPTNKEVFKVAASQDGYRVLFLNRLREAARGRVPGVNHALRMVQTALFGIEIGKDVTLGEGVNFTHTLGIVIGGDARIGARVKFMGNNTVGTAKDNGYPIIEDDVIVGCGARILGPIRVGARAVIGANAVVLSDVAPDTVVSGIPARPHRKRNPEEPAEG